MNDTKAVTEAKSTCDGQYLKHLAAAALTWLDHNHQKINTLNVFPVPDGDTGTNMLLTMRSAYEEAAEVEETGVGAVAQALSHGALMGARGNSGVILSQIWRGFARALHEAERFDADQLAAALREACDTAYKGVIKPVEGTILTVSRAMAEAAEAAVAEGTEDLTALLEHIASHAQEALERTPEQLPVLKQAGVVDAGGAGLVVILEGMLMYVQGNALATPDAVVVPVDAHEAHAHGVLPGDEVFEYPYDIQFIVRGENLDVALARATIDAMGVSTLVVGDARTIKVHVHVKDPGQPLSYGVSLGPIDDVVVENMLEQSKAFFGDADASDALSAPSTGIIVPDEGCVEVNPGDIAVIAVVSGDGLTAVYQSLGVASLVTGGQTMNPSTEELLAAIQNLPTDRVVLLPNNKNIMMAAKQASSMAREAGIDARVVPTVTLPQGISALMAFSAEGDLDQVAAAMEESKDLVVTAEVTTAVRSVEIDGVAVQEGQIIGLVDGNLVEAGDDLEQIVFKLLDQMKVTEQELITLYYGNGVSGAQAEALADKLKRRFTEQEVEVILGGQPHYHYILSTE